MNLKKKWLAFLNNCLCGVGWTNTKTIVSGQLQGPWFVNGTHYFADSSTNVGGRSTDGITWTNVTLPSSVNSMTYGMGLYVLVRAGTSYYSSDGLSWTMSVSGSLGSFVIFGGGMFVIGGYTGGDRLYYSSNGTTWTNVPGASFGEYYSGAYAAGAFVLSGFSGSVARSTDGINWTYPSMPNSRNWCYTYYVAGKWYLVTSGWTAISLDNGVTWNEYANNAVGVSLYGDSVIIDGFMYATSQNGGIAYLLKSANGTTWTTVGTMNPSSGNPRGISYGNKSLVHVDGPGQVFRAKCGC